MTWNHSNDADSGADDTAPLYGRRRRILIRTTVLVCVAALVLPGVLSLYSNFAVFAQTACNKAVVFSDPTARSARASFEVFGPGGIGWECYSTNASGERHVASFGLFPSDVTPEGPTNRA